jgi:hypothetical protein
MKKAVMFLVIASSVCTVSADQGRHGVRSDNTQIRHAHINNDQCRDEYEQGTSDDTLQEYEQHVCDHIQPPKISAAMALLTEVGGRVLIEFIMVREALRRYLLALKAAINNWFGLVTTQQ